MNKVTAILVGDSLRRGNTLAFGVTSLKFCRGPHIDDLPFLKRLRSLEVGKINPLLSLAKSPCFEFLRRLARAIAAAAKTECIRPCLPQASRLPRDPTSSESQSASAAAFAAMRARSRRILSESSAERISNLGSDHESAAGKSSAQGVPRQRALLPFGAALQRTSGRMEAQ